MQFQVPQFIETEDKIVGPLSIRQFIYIAAGGAVSAVLFFVLQTWLWIVFSIIFVGGAVAIAFVKIEGRPLTRIILSAFNFYWNPRTYVWQPDHPQVKLYQPPAEKKKKAVEPLPEKKAVLPAEKKEKKVVPPPEKPVDRKIAEGAVLHENWEALQTGEQMSDKQFIEKKMSGYYEIFQKLTGDRDAARRVDYR